MFKGKINTKRQYIKAWCDSLFIDHSIFRLFWNNLFPIIDQKIWRSNHPTPQRLRKLKETLSIKTVINLRGKRQCGSDALMRDACEKNHINYIDMAFESRRAPHKDRILNFYKIYKNLKNDSFPLLIHCKSGADRTGLASGLIILFENGTVKDAKRHLHWRFLHFSFSRTGVLDAFFKLYEENGEKNNITFLNWVNHYYDEEKLQKDYFLKK